jgi:predicted ATPase
VRSDAERFFVLTGGPGSGKSSLAEALEQAGYPRTIEAGRGIIQDQVAIGGPALPWCDPLLFAELMLCWEMRSYSMAQERTGPVFFDRGVPDVIGYLRLLGLPVPKHMERAAEVFRYNRRVFVAPPWPEIFQQDQERRQSLDEAVRTHDVMVTTYREYGYALVELPRASIRERLRFMAERAGIAGPG